MKMEQRMNIERTKQKDDVMKTDERRKKREQRGSEKGTKTETKN